MTRSSLALLLLAACATPSQPFEGHPVLAAIQFEGNRSISASDILGHIATAPTSGFFSKTARYYDADLFAIDLQRIVRFYNMKGFYEAKVLDVKELRDKEGRVTLVVKVDEGRRALVKQIDLNGLDPLGKDEVRDIRNALPLKPGDNFDEDAYEKAKEVLVDKLKEHGFAAAHATGKVQVAPEEGSAHLFLDSTPGPRYRFGKVVVSGNRQIAADQIAQATGIDKGDPYSPQALQLAQQRVYNLGTFSGVRVGLEPLGDTPVAAVRVNVREAPFHTFRFGIGGSAEDTRWELPRLRAEYTDRSLFGALRRLEIASTVGYAFVSRPWAYDPAQSGITTQTSAQLTVPNVLLPGLDLINRAEYAREVQAGFGYEDVAARVGLLYRRGRHSLAPSLNFVYTFNVNLRGADLGNILARSGPSSGILQDCPQTCKLTYPEIRYTFDGRDSAIEPTQGIYTSVSLQQTVKLASLSTFSYFRLNPDFRVYLPFTKFMVLAGRVEYGGLFAQDGSNGPFTQRFFFGGQNEQRGYAPLRQGPKLGTQPCTVGTDPGCTQPWARVSVPIGGKAALLFSGEVRIHADFILNHLGIVPFLDASKVGDDPRNPASGGLELAPGLGLRYLTAFGPIRLDVGWLANPKDVYMAEQLGKDAAGNTVQKVAPTRVSVHCSSNDRSCIHESRFAFHVTLGEAF